MTCRWVAALAVLTGVSACTPIEAVHAPYETGPRKSPSPPGLKTSRFQSFVATLPRCVSGQTSVAIDRLRDPADREVSVRGVLTYADAAPDCAFDGLACECCHACSLSLVLVNPSAAGVSPVTPVALMDDGDEATLSAISGTDSHSLGVWFGECERSHVVGAGDRADVIVTGVLRRLGRADAQSRWAIEAPSVCVVGGKGPP